jgi:RNA polymerase sigma-70 factor (ECF subfamily)
MKEPMQERDWLLRTFERHRDHLRSVAYRILGSRSEADDAVQEAWIRLSRTETSEMQNLAGWLTTVVARICIDALRSRKAHAEVPFEPTAYEPIDERGADPEADLALASSLGPALMVVLDSLVPAERVAFVLHDLFGVSFDEIAGLLGRTPAAARQLASRARRRVRGASAINDADHIRQREIVSAFLAASRNGDFAALLAVLDPDVVLRVDETALRWGAAKLGLAQETRGAQSVANLFKGRARNARLALVDGAAAAVFVAGGRLGGVIKFTIADGKIVEIGIVTDPTTLTALDVLMLETNDRD